MIEIFQRALFAENLALSFFLGMCTFLAVSRQVATAFGVGLSFLVVQMLSIPLNQLLYSWVLMPGALAWAGHPEVDLSFLRLIAFLGIVAALVQMLEMILDRHAPALHRAMGIYLPLMAINCAIIGGNMFMVERSYGFGESLVYALGSGLGWMLAITAFAAIRERLRYADIPKGLEGLGAAFIVAGIMSMGFSAFTGISLP